MTPWNLTALTQLFASDPDPLGDVDVSAEGDILRVTIKEKGGLDVFVAVSGDRDILVSAPLVPCADVPNSTEFEHMVLRTHKLIPLSSFGVSTIDGSEWYELFGSLSANSKAEVVVEEVAVLVANALDAASMIQEWKNGEYSS